MKPTDLSPASRQLLDAALDGDQPTAADRSRVRAALFAQLGIPAGGAAAGGGGGPGTMMNASSAPQAGASGAGASAAGGAASAGTAGAAKLAIGAAIAIGIAGGGYALVRRQADEPAIRPAAVAQGQPDRMPTPDLPAPSAIPDKPDSAGPDTAAPALPTPDSADQASAPDTAPAERPPRERSPHRRPAPAADASTIRLEQELISNANAALRNGDPAAALRLLDAHAARFPDGLLVEERSGARVVALCDLGHADARRAAARFLARWPRSVLAARIRAACK